MFLKRSHHLIKRIPNTLLQPNVGLRSVVSGDIDPIQYDYDTVIVGGGIVGLSTARILQSKYPLMKIALLEKESLLSQHQSTHNSGVIHCGIYYTPQSLKATLCVKGSQQMYDYCDAKNIKYKKDGKLIVAVDSSEISRLRALYERGLENQVPGLRLLESTAQIKQIEPMCDGLEAIWCETTGIVNFANVARSYGNDFTADGGTVLTNCEVLDFTCINRIMSKDFANGILVHTRDPTQTKNKDDLRTRNYLKCRHVITCCGVYSDRISQRTGAAKYPTIVPVRGDYLKIKNKALNRKFTGVNIYPVPDPKFPVLGVHFTPMFDANEEEIEYILGPTAVFAFGRENYWFTSNINISDVLDSVSSVGFWKMVKQHWKFGLKEFKNDILYKRQVDQLRKYVKELRYSDVERSFGGVRSQSMDKDGNLTDDFYIDTQCVDARNSEGRFLNVRNAPSPACTSSIAIGEKIVEEATKEFNLDHVYANQFKYF